MACSAPAGAPRSFASACAGLAAGTTIVGVASGQELRPDARYAGRLDAALTRLDRERAAARGALRERRAAAYQAQDARRISAAAATAATSIAAASPPAPARRVNGAIVRELRATASAYTALAAAATARDAAAFSAAGRAVAGAEARTARALRGLTVLGYAGRR